jgi:hypothetical protein
MLDIRKASYVNRNIKTQSSGALAKKSYIKT